MPRVGSQSRIPRDSPRWCEHCGRYGDHHTDRHPRSAEALELHETECYGRSVCVCQPARRKNTQQDFTVLTVDGIGRYLWSPILMDLRFVASGAQRETQNWSLMEKENTVEGARKAAARRARELLYDRPWLDVP